MTQHPYALSKIQNSLLPFGVQTLSQKNLVRQSPAEQQRLAHLLRSYVPKGQLAISTSAHATVISLQPSLSAILKKIENGVGSPFEVQYIVTYATIPLSNDWIPTPKYPQT